MPCLASDNYLVARWIVRHVRLGFNNSAGAPKAGKFHVQQLAKQVGSVPIEPLLIETGPHVGSVGSGERPNLNHLVLKHRSVRTNLLLAGSRPSSASGCPHFDPDSRCHERSTILSQ